MLVVISYPTAVADEANSINALFDEGLKILHLRKPGIAKADLCLILNAIRPYYRYRIALHQHHEIAAEFGINRLHFTESGRKTTSYDKLSQLKQLYNNKLSTSIHQLDDYVNLPSCFDYTFFGPVFNSISKQGYISTLPENFKFPLLFNQPDPIALGGIDATNIQKALDMQFSGVAALGIIWKKPGESIQQFKTLQKAWMQTGR